MPEESGEVFYSNRVEVLYERLKSDLFNGTLPFTKRLVIVPSPAIKSWLMLQMAKDADLGIALGIEILFVDPAINRLAAMLIPNQQLLGRQLQEPSELELGLAIEQEIYLVIRDFFGYSEHEQKIWAELLGYIQVSSKTNLEHFSKRSAKRISLLSQKMACIFLDYGRLGGKMIEKWNATIASDWQHALWMRMEEFFSIWNYPYRKLEAFDPITAQENVREKMHVFLFGLSYLPPVQHRFLVKVAGCIPLSAYLMSPCQKFWGDLLSEKESGRLLSFWQKRGVSLSQQEDLNNYLINTNPLLANFGKLGREMTLQIEESQLPISEIYALPSSLLAHEEYLELLDDDPIFYETNRNLSLLEAVQSDIALLRNPELGEPLLFDQYDHTIQVHAAIKPMREVEAIYDSVMKILDRHKQDDPPILPEDVLVMVPNILQYSPYIRSVFGKEEGKLEFQIMDAEVLSNYSLVQGFLHLLNLPSGRFDAAALLRLFEYPSFQARHQLSREDVQELYRWVKMGKIRWGKDENHRNELLKRDHCKKEMFEEGADEILGGRSSGTWEHGFGRLLEGMAMFSEDGKKTTDESSFCPINGIESAQGDLLGKVIHLLRSLLEDVGPLNDGTKMTPKEWALYLECLLETYFSAASQDDREGQEAFIQELNSLAMLRKSLESSSFTFYPIQRYLEGALRQESIDHRQSKLHGVRFCPLMPMRAIPAKVVVLMGVDDTSFPRRDEKSALNHLIFGQDGDYDPSRVDFDRHLFLEALLSSRRYFILSYVSSDKGDGKEQAPSLLAVELLSYLDKAYRIPSGKISDECVFTHPLYPFDQRHFLSGSRTPSYFPSYYLAALSYYAPQKTARRQFISTFDPIQTDGKEVLDQVLINLSELSAFARHPLKSYFNGFLGMRLEKEEEVALSLADELQLSSLDAAMIPRDAIFSELSCTINRAKLSGRLPPGPFRVIGEQKVVKEAESLKANLANCGLIPDQVVSLEFSDRFISVICDKGSWQMPALTVKTKTSAKIKISGKIEMVSSEGLVVFGEDQVQDVVKVWPIWLVFCTLIKRFQLPSRQNLLLIKGKSGIVKSNHCADPEQMLTSYLDYALSAKSTPSPLMPDWVLPILSCDREELEKVIQKGVGNPFQPSFDDYLKWLGRNAPCLDTLSIIENWQGVAKSLFSPMIAAWYPKLLKKMAVCDEDI